MPERMAYWGTCDDCLTTMVVYPHHEREPLPEPDDADAWWEDQKPSCPVCGNGYIDLGNSDPVEGFRL